jgi:AcrR family transcriptional regulator
MASEGDTRQRLLESARDRYLDEGLVGLSMRKVARAAGVSATAIYRHFDSKEALLAAICGDAGQVFAEYLWRGLDGATARERLELTGVGYMRFALEQAPYYRVLFMSPLVELGYEELSAAAQKKVAPNFQFLVDRVRECIDARVIVDGDPMELATTIWAHTHGLVSLYLGGQLRRTFPQQRQFEEFYHRSVARLLDGLAS